MLSQSANHLLNMCIAQYIQSPVINNQVDILKYGIEHAEPIQVIKVSSQEVDYVILT